MRKTGMLGTSALGSAAFIAFALATPAHGQATQPAPDATQPQDQAQDQASAQADVQTAQAPETGNEPGITVTGTRIRRPNLQSPVPIT